jgi:hypothetical protein
MTRYGSRSSGVGYHFEVPYFHSGFFIKSLLVRRHASRRTEAHVPVVMKMASKAPAALVAARSWDRDATGRKLEVRKRR